MISIIIPVYNTEQYLPECIESILAQTFQDFELILVNDGSKDGSGKVCDEYAKKDERIRVIHKENGGVSKARNTGLDAAQGQYVMFCDADDYAEPQWCEMLYKQIQKHPKSWCFCGCHCVDANRNYTAENCVLHNEPIFESFPISNYKEVYDTNYSALLWNRIFDIGVIREHNIRFDEQMSVSEDVLFNLHYGAFCDEFAVVNMPLYNHRVYLNNEVEHLDGKRPKEMFYTNQQVYKARRKLISQEEQREFNTDFFYRFIEDIRAVSNNEEHMKAEKLKRIAAIAGSKEFQVCMKNADTSKESGKFLLILKSKVPTLIYHIFKRG